MIETIDTAMPLSCSVPKCHQKGDFTPAGTKVNYFKFPKLLSQRKQWIQAIWRDEKRSTITERTTVCSRHFRREDLRKSLSGRIFIFGRDSALPSKFAWSVPSPTKGKPR